MRGRALVLTVALGLTGCGAASTAGNFPIVVSHLKVQSTGVPSVPQGEALMRPPSQVVFNTTGSSSCVWWPTRLTVLDATTVRIDMRVNGVVSRCSGGAVPFPIAVNLPRIIDLHRALTVQLAFKVRLPNGGGINQFERTVVAPALSG